MSPSPCRAKVGTEWPAVAAFSEVGNPTGGAGFDAASIAQYMQPVSKSPSQSKQCLDALEDVEQAAVPSQQLAPCGEPWGRHHLQHVQHSYHWSLLWCCTYRVLLLFTLGFFVCVFLPTPFAHVQKVALVIINADHDNVERPSKLVKRLIELGYRVVERTNASLAVMNEAFESFGSWMSTGCSAVVYFCGLGWQDSKLVDCLLAPVDVDWSCHEVARVCFSVKGGLRTVLQGGQHPQDLYVVIDARNEAREGAGNPLTVGRRLVPR
jgi:hypothetical protein